MTRPKQEHLERLTENMTIWLESPDLVCIRPTGEVDAADMRAVTAYYERHIRNWPYVLILVDQSGTSSLSPEARKVAAKDYDWVPFRGTVFHGGSFAMRTIGQLIIKLINSMRQIDNPLLFVKTEAEARAWIEERRRELNEKSPLAKKTG